MTPTLRTRSFYTRRSLLTPTLEADAPLAVVELMAGGSHQDRPPGHHIFVVVLLKGTQWRVWAPWLVVA